MNETLRKEFTNSTLKNKTCRTCKKEYPRTIEFFYPVRKNKFNREIITGYDYQCIPCSNERSKKWKQDNKNKKRESNIKYKMTEIGFFKELYNGVRKKEKQVSLKILKNFINVGKNRKKYMVLSVLIQELK